MSAVQPQSKVFQAMCQESLRQLVTDTAGVENACLVTGDGLEVAAVLAQKLEAKIELREPAEPEQIHFKETEIFQVVFVPLNHRALRHGGVFNGNKIVHRFVSQKKTAGMNREMARKIKHLIGELNQPLILPSCWVQAHLLQASR